MIEVERVDWRCRRQVARFADISYRLYADYPCWVPPLRGDILFALNRRKHPFYEHSDAEFFLALREGRDVGRIAALENRAFNCCHGTRQGQLYFFECENDQEAAAALFDSACGWASARGLETITGPKGLSALDGYGVLVEGFEHRQLMTMSNYNFPYYGELFESCGFRREVDFVSCRVRPGSFRMPERIRRVVDRVRRSGFLRVHTFRSKRELARWAPRIGDAYNRAFVHNWEYYPLSRREISLVLDNILLVADPRLIKVIMHGNDIVGFLFGFPDLSAALQRARGRLLPFGLFHLLREKGRARWMALNGAGILPEFQGCGGNALLYSEMEKTVRDFGFEQADLTQIAETAVQMQKDLLALGAEIYKRHRIYTRSLR